MTVIDPELIIAIVALAFTAFPCVFGTFWAYLPRDGDSAGARRRNFVVSVLAALVLTAAAVVPMTVVFHNQAVEKLEEENPANDGDGGDDWAFRDSSAVAASCGGQYSGYVGRGAREASDPACRGARDGYWQADYYEWIGAGECVAISTCARATEFSGQIRVAERGTAECVATTVDVCPDDAVGATVSFYARPNVEYAVIIDSPDKATGNYQVSFNCTECAAPTPPPAASLPPTPTPYDAEERIWKKANLLAGAQERLLEAHESWQLYLSLAVVSGVFLLCSCIFLGSLADSEITGSDNKIVYAFGLSISFTFLLIGFSLFAELSKDVALIDRFQYEGPVYITGYRIVDDDSLFQRGSLRDEGFRAELMLQWTGTWGCPYEPEENCAYASNPVDECHRRACKKLRACTPDERESAKESALSCLSEAVNGFDFEATTLKFNASVPPEENGEWPKRTGYYECAGACAFEESLDDSIKRVRVLKGTGWTFVALGLAFFGAVLGCLLSLVPGAVYSKFS